MLLETFESDISSIIVFSRNILDPDENFGMIFKKDSSRKIHQLYLYDVCGLINNAVPKNLIVYRLLSNLEGLVIEKSEYGCFINTSDGKELVYPDPLYAVKELEYLSNKNHMSGLKFSIQQVGFTTSSVEEDKIIFSEVFNFDLDSPEVQSQNDSVFIEALLHKKRREPENRIHPDFSNIITEEIPVLIDDNYEFNSGNKRIKREFHSEEITKNASVIGIFRSLEVLKDYLQVKGKKKSILKFK
jgi:hypothetical protein